MNHILSLGLVVSLFLSLPVFASPKTCYEKLTKNYTEDSRGFKLNTDAFSADYRDLPASDYLAHAIYAVRATVAVVGCHPGQGVDINFSMSFDGRSAQSNCARITRAKSEMKEIACYVETNLGKFEVMWDDFQSVYVIYSRWD